MTATVPGILATGIHADRPAATAVESGSLYSCTTHDLIYQSDGASWSTWATVGGAGAGAPASAPYLTGAADAGLSAEIVVMAPASGGKVPFGVYKTADESVTSSTALQNDDHLVMAIAANEVWRYSADLFWEADGTGDIKFAFTGPAGVTEMRLWHGFGTDGAGGTNNEDTTYTGSGTVCGSHQGQGAGTVRHTILGGYIANGGTAGNLQLQWAQNTSNAVASIMKKYSSLLAWRLA